jgi:hypothetical protein
MVPPTRNALHESLSAFGGDQSAVMSQLETRWWIRFPRGFRKTSGTVAKTGLKDSFVDWRRIA